MRVVSNYTTGPWVQVKGTPIIIAGKGNNKLIASAAVKGMPIPEQVANARLIATAPDLLAALINVVAEWGDDIDDPFWNSARAAIERAT